VTLFEQQQPWIVCLTVIFFFFDMRIVSNVVCTSRCSLSRLSVHFGSQRKSC